MWVSPRCGEEAGSANCLGPVSHCTPSITCLSRRPLGGSTEQDATGDPTAGEKSLVPTCILPASASPTLPVSLARHPVVLGEPRHHPPQAVLVLVPS